MTRTYEGMNRKRGEAMCDPFARAQHHHRLAEKHRVASANCLAGGEPETAKWHKGVAHEHEAKRELALKMVEPV